MNASVKAWYLRGMPRACRDALSREIYEPVFDPSTGNCYRNPCAAEEAGVVDWRPGCLLEVPSYGGEIFAPSTDAWASEVWWGGPRRGGRRRRRGPGGGPRRGGGLVRQPGGSLYGGNRGGLVRQPGGSLYGKTPGGGGVVRQPGGMSLSRAPQGGLFAKPAYASASPLAPSYTVQMTPTARFSGSIKSDSGLRVATPSYASAPSMSPSGGQSVQSTPTARSTASLAPATTNRVATTGYASASRATLKGLGQDATEHPLARAISSVTAAWARTALLVALGATVPPLLVGGLVRMRTKSWGKALAAGVATGAAEVAVLGAMRDRRTASTPSTTSSSPIAMAYIR